MKSSIVVLFLTLIASTLASDFINITIPNMSTTWHFGQVEVVRWVTERQGKETGYLVSI